MVSKGRTAEQVWRSVLPSEQIAMVQPVRRLKWLRTHNVRVEPATRLYNFAQAVRALLC